MKLSRRLLAFLAAALMFLSMSCTVRASEPDDMEGDILQMLTYYVYYQERAETDIARLNADLGQNYPTLAKAWENIMHYWAWVDQEMAVTPDILPDGLPEDDSLCIVVLGYALNPTGSMKDELVGRLEVALASAVKYPNAYILCTGGGTASRNEKKTEAGQMANWLKKHNIDKSRIIIEDESLSTIQNAQYSCKILAQDYPQVRHLALISSDYHVPRGCVYFNTQLALTAYENSSEPLDIVGNAGYQTGSNYTEDIPSLYTGIAQIAGIDFKTQAKPTLSKLTGLEVDGEFTYETGTAMTLTATAVYDSGFTRDVTSSTIFSGVDMNQSGEQLLTVTYSENGIEIAKQMLVDVTSGYAEELDVQLTEEDGQEAAEETSAAIMSQIPETTASGVSPAPIWPFVILAALLALLALLLRLKIRNNQE